MSLKKLEWRRPTDARGSPQKYRQKIEHRQEVKAEFCSKTTRKVAQLSNWLNQPCIYQSKTKEAKMRRQKCWRRKSRKFWSFFMRFASFDNFLSCRSPSWTSYNTSARSKWSAIAVKLNHSRDQTWSDSRTKEVLSDRVRPSLPFPRTSWLIQRKHQHRNNTMLIVDHWTFSLSFCGFFVESSESDLAENQRINST